MSSYWSVEAIAFDRDGSVRHSADGGETQDYARMVVLAERAARRLGYAQILCDGGTWGHITAAPDPRGDVYPKVLVRGGNGWAAEDQAREESRQAALREAAAPEDYPGAPPAAPSRARDHRAASIPARPVTLGEAQIAYRPGGAGRAAAQRRYDELTWQLAAATQQQRLQAEGTWDATRNRHCEPLDAAGYLELIATGAYLDPRRSREPMTHRALQAGATWAEVAAAAGTTQAKAYAAYWEWAAVQESDAVAEVAGKAFPRGPAARAAGPPAPAPGQPPAGPRQPAAGRSDGPGY